MISRRAGVRKREAPLPAPRAGGLGPPKGWGEGLPGEGVGGGGGLLGSNSLGLGVGYYDAQRSKPLTWTGNNSEVVALGFWASWEINKPPNTRTRTSLEGKLAWVQFRD